LVKIGKIANIKNVRRLRTNLALKIIQQHHFNGNIEALKISQEFDIIGLLKEIKQLMICHQNLR